MTVKLSIFNNKNVVLIAGVSAFAVLVLLQFIYMPKYREVRKLTAEYKEATKEIDELYNFIGGRQGLEKNILNIRKDLTLLRKAFPSEKEISDIIKQLNDEARHFKVNVISLKPRNLSMYKDSDGGELKVAGYLCKSMPLTLNVDGKYQAVGEFIADLESGMDPLIVVEEIVMRKKENSASGVEAEIGLDAFMLGR
ncbi:MAG: type II secretion system protein M [Candidatus Omnitrophica bacterium]|nr:type II secretion system protein M [Candidatus Omnitrophota bacterium]